MRIVIFGGGGFIGQHLAAELSRRGHALILPVRNRERVKKNLILLPNTDVFAYNPANSAAVLKALAGADVAINLVGILNEPSRNFFNQVHGEFVRMLMDGCNHHKVPRIVQISAIGAADSAPSAYLRSKAKSEQIIRSNDAVRHAIIRPSVVFGDNDQFINKFASMLRLMPAFPLPGAEAKMQPIAVGDLVALVAAAVEDGEMENAVWHAGGPEVLTLRQIVEKTAAALGLRRAILPLGDGASYAAAAVLEKIPFVELITCDNCLSMRVPSVCPKNGNDAQKILGDLTNLDFDLTRMLAPKKGFGAFRVSARR